ncbi:MAG: PAS domain S-box protein [Candidatus Saganbacteria bacterium]|nr:PAS domain S-box protein [Candidatus Saganbacteria bacterium]
MVINYSPISAWLSLTTGALTLLMGLFVYFRSERKQVHLLFSLVAGCLWLWSNSIALLYLQINNILGLDCSQLVLLTAVPIPLLTFFFSQTFPNRKMHYSAAALTIYLLPSILISYFILWGLIISANPINDALVISLGSHQLLFYLYIISYFTLAGYNFIRNYNRAPLIEKNKYKYFFSGILSTILIVVGFNLSSVHLFGSADLIFMGPLGTLILVGTTAYAMLKYRLMDISLVLKKTTAYSLMTFAITFFYVLVVIIFESLFRSYYGRYSFWASIPAAFVIAVTFMPVRHHLQNMTDRIFFRRTIEYQQVIKDVTKLIVSVTDLNTLFRLIDRTIVRAMCVKSVAVLLFEEKAKHYLVEKTNGHPADFLKQQLSPDSALAKYLAQAKDAVVLEECRSQQNSSLSSNELKAQMLAIGGELERFGASVAIPSFTKGRLVGILCLGEKLSGEPYSPEDLELLLTMAQEAGIAIENAKLYRDITETRDYLNDLVQGSDDAILTFDLSGKVMSWNRGAEHIFGYTAEEVMDKYPPFLSRDELQGYIDRIINNDTLKAIELEKYSKSGKPLPLLLTISPIHDQAEQIIGLSLIIKDISSLRKVEQLKHEFLSVVSHELRTPLTPIKGYLSLLLDESLGRLEVKQKEALKVILGQSNHLHDLIDSVIDISRIESGRPLELQKEPLFIEEVIQASLDASANAIAAKHINLTLLCPSEKLALMGDRKKLLRAFDNILGNAVKFTPVKGEINIAIEKDHDQLKVSIADSGIGLEDGELEKIFKPFYQVDTSYTRSCGGIGMGLSIAREIVEAHDGKLWAESGGLGKGSRFTFVI